MIDAILESKKPLVIWWRRKIPEAGEALLEFCEEFNIPFAETQAGKRSQVQF